MKKNDLKIGDVVVLRSGAIAVVTGESDDKYLLFQEGGFEFFSDYYDDDLVYLDNEDAVMQVYRSDNALGFDDIEEESLIFERDETWSRPTKKESAQSIGIIAQAFYGNRMYTTIDSSKVDRFIMGYIDDGITETNPYGRTVIFLPGSCDVVLIYNPFEEAKSREYARKAFKEDNYVMRPLAVVSEINLEIYSRCIVCRMGADGRLMSVENEDAKIWKKYLAD